MKLAPLLFDADRIEAAVSKRLDDVLFKVKFGGRSGSAAELDAMPDIPDPRPAAEPRIRQYLSVEAWAALSLKEKEEVRFHWRFSHLIWDVVLSAQKGLDSELLCGEVEFSESLKLIHRGIDLAKFCRRWSPALPAALPSETETPAQAPSDQKLIDLMARVRAWQSDLTLKEAA
jgi:hypothetical protein